MPKRYETLSPNFWQFGIIIRQRRCRTISNLLSQKISDNVVAFTREGRWNVTDAEPTLFPSCDNRDWGKFNIPDQNKAERQLKPFDEVLVRDNDDSKWVCDFFEGIPTSSVYEYSCVLRGLVHQCIPYEGNEHLLGTTKKPEVNNEAN